jgi:hypothetical protein
MRAHRLMCLMGVATGGLRRIVVIQGTGGCPFLTGGCLARRKGRLAGQELRPYQEAEARRKLDHKAWQMEDVRYPHELTPPSLQPQQFQRQLRQHWQPGVVKLSLNAPIPSQMLRQM